MKNILSTVIIWAIGVFIARAQIITGPSIGDIPGLQTALDAKIPSGPLRVACVGTSITYQGSSLNGTTITDNSAGHAGWLEHISNHRVRLVRRYGVSESSTDKTFGYSGYQLPGLTDGSSGVYPLDNAIASGAEVLILEGGTNDLAAGSTTVLSRITSYWTKAAASGIRCIAFNVLPTGSGTEARDTITTVNAALPALASNLGITLLDTHAIATLDGSGFATTETLWDGVHPTPAYAHRMAKLVDAQISTLYARRNQEFIVPHGQGTTVAAGSFVSGRNYRIITVGTTNFMAIGATASTAGLAFVATGVGSGTGTAMEASQLWITPANSPSQASRPDGWSKGGSYTDTWTAQTDSDGTTWQRLRIQQTGTAGAACQIYSRATSGYTAGDKVRVCFRIRSVDSATFSARDFMASLRYYIAGYTYARAIDGGANQGVGDFDPVSGLYVSPEITLPSGTITALDAILEIYVNTEVTIDIRQMGVFKVLTNP